MNYDWNHPYTAIISNFAHNCHEFKIQISKFNGQYHITCKFGDRNVAVQFHAHDHKCGAISANSISSDLTQVSYERHHHHYINPPSPIIVPLNSNDNNYNSQYSGIIVLDLGHHRQTGNQECNNLLLKALPAATATSSS